MPRKRKATIPEVIKCAVWNRYIGEENGVGICMCCMQRQIAQRRFHCGHVIAESMGGEIVEENLRPICDKCNLSMSSMNMVEFKKKFKFVFPKKWNGINHPDYGVDLQIPIEKQQLSQTTTKIHITSAQKTHFNTSVKFIKCYNTNADVLWKNKQITSLIATIYMADLYTNRRNVDFQMTLFTAQIDVEKWLEYHKQYATSMPEIDDIIIDVMDDINKYFVNVKRDDGVLVFHIPTILPVLRCLFPL